MELRGLEPLRLGGVRAGQREIGEIRRQSSTVLRPARTAWSVTRGNASSPEKSGGLDMIRA
ncbi:hypothetical protein SEA_LTON_32 [Gordonia phage Lton]|nr:hypothetical protein SEA_LTON_32 [Gordonia phage Lton]